MRAVWLILMLSCGSCFAQTPAVCPWISTGSAVEAFGGPVELNLHIESNGQGTCRFVHGSGAEEEAIEISIGKVDTHACSAGSFKMIGLGNEAVACRLKKPEGASLDVITGRVRDIYFVVDIRSPHEPSADFPAQPHSDPDNPSLVERVAEQVVGNLY